MVGAGSAAGKQTAAADRASGVSREMFDKGYDFSKGVYDTTRNDLADYRNVGSEAMQALRWGTGVAGVGTDSGGNPFESPLLKPFSMSQADLENTPGYQFAKTQGLKGVGNAAAARGLGTSGAALKGAATFATGLADTTYGNQFDRYRAGVTDQFNRLMTMAGLGQTAAAAGAGVGASTAGSIMTGAVGTGGNIGNNLVGAGNAQGAAAMAPVNAISSGTTGLSNYAMMNDLMRQSRNPPGGSMYNAG